jgi:hypothetical protein
LITELVKTFSKDIGDKWDQIIWDAIEKNGLIKPNDSSEYADFLKRNKIRHEIVGRNNKFYIGEKYILYTSEIGFDYEDGKMTGSFKYKIFE